MSLKGITMDIIEQIKVKLDTRELCYKPVTGLDQLSNALEFSLDDEFIRLMSEIGHVELDDTRMIYGYGNVTSDHDLYQVYLRYQDTKRFFPSNSLPVIHMSAGNDIVYDVVQRKVMIVDTADQGEIKYTFDGGLLEVVLAFIK